jgi:hypothetical protein
MFFKIYLGCILWIGYNTNYNIFYKQGLLDSILISTNWIEKDLIFLID